MSSATYSADAYDDQRAKNRTNEDVTAYMPFYGTNNYKLTGRGEPQPVSGVMVTDNFFQMLGVQPGPEGRLQRRRARRARARW